VEGKDKMRARIVKTAAATAVSLLALIAAVWFIVNHTDLFFALVIVVAAICILLGVGHLWWGAFAPNEEGGE
jgi:peptidoglycan/LPS O-acetylase OafA/YrhL